MARRFTWFDRVNDLETDFLGGMMMRQISNSFGGTPLEPLVPFFSGVETIDPSLLLDFGLGASDSGALGDPLDKPNISQFFLSALDGTNGFFLNGEGSNDESGNSVSGVGDINGDGIDDFIIGASRAGGDEGAAYVVFGTTLGFPVNFELGSLNGVNGFVITGAVNLDEIGFSVAGGGDVNGDGIDDIVIGAPGAEGEETQAGEVFVIYGSLVTFSALIDVFSDLDGVSGSRINGISAFDFTGISVSIIGDFNGDGIDDILIGSEDADPNGDLSGQSYVVFGQVGGFGSDFDLSGLDGFNGFALNGIFGDPTLGGDNSGHSVSGIGDINDDGLDDIIIGAPNADPNALDNSGQAYVIFGTGASFTSGFELASLLAANGGDGSLGFAINGITAGDQLGSAVTNVGDVNNDGIDDFAVLAPGAPGQGASAGEVYIIYGNNGGFAAELDVTNLTSPQGFTINGRADGDALSSVSAAGDFNGDGIADILIGSETGQINDIGEAYIVFGVDGNPSVDVNLGLGGGVISMLIEGISANDRAGSSVSAAGDVNGDGIDDILIGAPGGDPNSNANSGESYIVFGSTDFGPNAPTARDDIIDASTANSLFDLLADNGNGADSDPNGDFITITEINGVAVTAGDSVTLSSGVVVTLVFDFISGNTLVRFSHASLALGDTVADTFTYTIDDGTGGTSTANVAVDFLQNGILPANLDGTNGFTVNGASDNDRAGDAVAMIGDVNGDGIDDFMVASGNVDTNSNENSGAAYVVFGSVTAFPTNFNLASLDGTNGYILNGVNAFDRAGNSVSGLGDINGDGIDDFIIGAEDANGDAGQSYVVFGSLTAPGASFDLADLLGVNGGDGSLGFVINGAVGNDQSGASVSSAGDVNGDGIDDLIVGAPNASSGTSGEGETYIVFGTNLGFSAELDTFSIDGTNGFIVRGADAGDGSGSSVTGIGDINGDGFDDILVGANRAEGIGGISTGESYVVFGTASPIINGIFVGTMPASEGFTISGITDFDFSGVSVSGGGDVNGDGIDDLIIGASGVDRGGLSNAGATYVIFGSTGGFGTDLDLSSLDGTNGFVINGIINRESSGSSVANAGDFNGDGFDDVVIGAPGQGENGLQGAYILFGSGTGFSAGVFNLEDLDGTNGVFVGAGDGGAFAGTGGSVDGAGDVNNDGFDDVIVGSPGSGINSVGQSYIIFGFSTNTPPVASNDAITTNEDAIVGANIFADNGFGPDEDADGDIFTVTEVDGSLSSVGVAVAGTNGGLFTINANGVFNFDPNGEFEALQVGDQDTTTITYTIDDGNGGTDEATVTVTVQGRNDAPIAQDDNFITDEDTGIAGNVFDDNDAGVDSDIDSSVITVNDVDNNPGNVGLPASGDNGGLFTINTDGSFDFDPNSNFEFLAEGETVDTAITYVNVDNAASPATSNTATVTVTVTGVNDAPIAEDDFLEVDEDDGLTGSVFDINAFGSGGAADFDPDTSDTFNVIAVDGASTGVGSEVFGDQGGVFLINADGSFDFDTNGDFDFLGIGESLETTVSYTIADGNGDTSTASVFVTVNGVNDDPIAQDDDLVTNENSIITGSVFSDNGNGADFDIENDALSVSDVNNSASDVGATVAGTNGGTFLIAANGTYTFDPGSDFSALGAGDTQVTTATYNITDGNGGFSAAATVTVTVSGVSATNTDPVAVEDLFTTDEVSAATGNVFDDNGNGVDSDADGDTFTVTVVNGEGSSGGVGVPVNGEGGGVFVIGADGSFDFDPNGDFDGLAVGETSETMASYTIDDGNGGTSSADVLVTVVGLDINQAPIANDDTFNVGESTQITGSVFDDNNGGVDSDPDGDTLTVLQVEGSVSSVGQTVTGSNGGTFIINADGTFNFDTGTDFNTLIDDETVTTSITYTVDDGNGGSDTATVTVTVTGAPPPFFNLADLNGTNGFSMTVLNADDEAGFSVANAGDINGDGVDDLLVGSHFANPGGNNDAGQTYVVFGGTNVFNVALDLTALDGSDGFAINGINPFDNSGWSIAAAGDVNGDGIDDIMVGAQLSDSTTDGQIGQTYVIFGSAGGFDANLNVVDLNGTNGFTLNGIDDNDQSGYSVSGAGDVNGDGIADMIIGARAADPNGDLSGETYVVFGSAAGFEASIDLADINGTNGFVINGDDANDRSGRAVSSAGDVNGDGIDDILIGANRAENGAGGTDSGIAYIVFGNAAGFGASLELADLNGTNGFALSGVTAGEFTGFSVTNAGDFNGDGIDDILVGAPTDGAAGTAGRAYLVFGTAAGFSANLDLSTLDGTNGFAFEGIAGDDQFGFSVTGAGDVNGDGLDDVLIGAPQANGNGSADAGQAYLIFGTADNVGPINEIARLADGQGIAINGISAGDLAGFSVSAAGDVNGDGTADILIGAPGGGQSYVILGVPNVSVTPKIVGIETDNLVYSAAGGAQTITGSLSILDSDNTDLTGASIAIVGGFDAINDHLLFTDQNGIMGSYDAGTGVLTLSGNASLANYEAALLSVVYENAFTTQSAAARTISFTVNDGVNTSAAGTRTISFPVIDQFNGTALADVISDDFSDSQIFSGINHDFLSGGNGNAGNGRALKFEDSFDNIEMQDGPSIFADLTVMQVNVDTHVVSSNGSLALKEFSVANVDASNLAFINSVSTDLPLDKQSAPKDLSVVNELLDDPFIVDQDVIATFLSQSSEAAPIVYMGANGMLAMAVDLDTNTNFAEILDLI